VSRNPPLSVASTTGLLGVGTGTPVARLEVVTGTDTNDGRPSAFDTKYLTVGTGGATGGAVYISYRLSTTTGYIGCIKPGTANQVLHVQNTGASTGSLLLGSSGTAIGLYGVTATTRQLLATGAGATVDNVITVLQTIGLCRQS